VQEHRGPGRAAASPCSRGSPSASSGAQSAVQSAQTGRGIVLNVPARFATRCRYQTTRPEFRPQSVLSDVITGARLARSARNA
jgi:hypothetical protein